MKKKSYLRNSFLCTALVYPIPKTMVLSRSTENCQDVASVDRQSQRELYSAAALNPSEQPRNRSHGASCLVNGPRTVTCDAESHHHNRKQIVSTTLGVDMKSMTRIHLSFVGLNKCRIAPDIQHFLWCIRKPHSH